MIGNEGEHNFPDEVCFNRESEGIVVRKGLPDVWDLECELPKLTIPSHYRAGVAMVGHLDEVRFKSLLEHLKGDVPAQTADTLATGISLAIPAIPKEVGESILTAIGSMQTVQRQSHVDAQVFADDVWAAMKSDSPSLLDKIKPDLFKRRIASLLSETSIELTNVKVAELRREVERNFCGTRILMDARTAFGSDTSLKPAMTIMQTLEITFHDDTGQHREFYVSVDDNDLVVLKEAIERAQGKKETLVRSLKEAEFQVFE